MKKTAIYGGTFNPIHNGHVIALQALEDSELFQEIFLMPAGFSPFKQESADIMHHRFAMAELVTRQLPFTRLNRIEESDSQPSYTYKTLQKLQLAEPETKFYWSIGYDNLDSIIHWKDADKLLNEFGLVVINRGGFSPDKAKNLMAKLRENYGTDIIEVTMPDVQISSSDIRTRIHADKSIYGFCPLEVVHYIKKYKLYKEYPDE